MLDELARHPDPYPRYDELRARGVHRIEDGRWIVPTAAGVRAVLSHPDAVVALDPPMDPVRSLMARFSDGPAHTRRRLIATTTLSTVAPTALRHRARELTLARIADRDEVEVMGRIARFVPVAVVAEALGFDPAVAMAATRRLALALAPVPAGTAPGDALSAVRDVVTDPADEVAVNTVALLFQTIDATAGLIGNAVVGGRAAPTPFRQRLARNLRRRADRTGKAPDVDELVRQTNRLDPSVQLTTRFTREPIDVSGTTIPAGETIVVLLAAANRDPFGGGEVFTFGVGQRPCPGSAHALVLAAGVLDVLTADGVEVLDQTITYEDRPNLRIPTQLTLNLRPCRPTSGRSPSPSTSASPTDD